MLHEKADKCIPSVGLTINDVAENAREAQTVAFDSCSIPRIDHMPSQSRENYPRYTTYLYTPKTSDRLPKRLQGSQPVRMAFIALHLRYMTVRNILHQV